MKYRFIACAVVACWITAITDLSALEMPWVFADHMVLQRDMAVPVWGTTSPGETVTISFGNQQEQAIANAKGNWRVTLPPMSADGEGRTLLVKSTNPKNGTGRKLEIEDVLVGEVWLCAGQSNMWYPLKSCTGGKEAAATAGNPSIRLLNRQANAYPSSGAWKPATLAKCTVEKFYSGTWVTDAPGSALPFSGVAYWFGKRLQADLKVPIGLINVAVGGTTTEAYTSRAGLLSHPLLRPIIDSSALWVDNEHVSAWPRKRGRDNLSDWLKHKTPPMPRHPFEPTFLFESGIQPLVPMAFRGVIWYQGESNATDADNVVPVSKAKVRAGIETTIKDWRTHWGREFPFLYVQLPGMGRPWELFREVQLECLEIPNTGMAISIDVGDPRDVHPRNKRPVGERLALWALATTYGKEVVYSGPLVQESGVGSPASAKATAGRQESEGSLLLSFDHTGTGLATSDRKAPRGFEIAGKDGRYHPAQAIIDGHDVIVSSPQVPEPFAVRYAWAPYPDCNLVNSAGLPASPFRTDKSEPLSVRD
jgi:sialate O-acetylesterase